ncbi:MAG TPA: SRPBCC domain-containing protein [Fimbriimonadaceae bacterium]|nr:ATPase [Armatimonadota bacterium]HRD30589.1 SRPBCC domain-containing protein [Fimbriimonadaceae bacterium]HRE92750.1 SRPBCC domain-containing protein [Fimbriimonadaceae bacterium]HRI74042.1 SRPBCC domain-containing protein [Fimbriimonadaceae bacterium]
MDQVNLLSCGFSIKIDRPIEDVFDSVFRADKLARYFAAGAKGDLVPGAKVTWQFHDFPEAGDMPIEVVETRPNELIHLRWESCVADEWNDVKITFERLENDQQTLVRVTESGWPKTDQGIQGAIDNSGGWANAMTCLKAYCEHGIGLREFAFGS